MIRLFLFLMLAPGLAVSASEPWSALTEGERCYMDCRRETHTCSVDCRAQHPKDSREAFECDLDCGDRMDRLCTQRCGLMPPE